MKKIILAVSYICLLCACTSTNQESMADLKKGSSEEREIWKYNGEPVITAGAKDETVTVKADAYGKPKKITSEVTLRDIGKEDIVRDYSDLTSVRNRKGDEEFDCQDKVIYWQNHGEDITYTGTSEKEIPVDVNITYWLDDEEIKAEDLSGKSGSFRMRFDYTNKEKTEIVKNGRTYEMFVPFTAVSMAVLPEDCFKNIEVENGTVASMNNQSAAVGYVFPGLRESLVLDSYENLKEMELPEYIEIRADVENFKLDFTTTIITSGIFSEINDDDLNKLTDFSKSMNDLQKGTDELVKAASTVTDGINTYKTYLAQYIDGVSSVNQGAQGISSGIGQIAANETTLTSGAKALSEGLGELNQSLSGISLSKESFEQMASGVDVLSENITAENSIRKNLTTVLKASENQLTDEQINRIVSDYVNTANMSQMKEQLSLASAGLRKIGENMTGLDALKAAVSELAGGSSSLYQGIKALTAGIDSLASGAKQLAEGTAQLSASGNSLKDGMNTIASGISEYRDGIKKYNEEGIRELTKIGTGEVKEIQERIAALKEIDQNYTSYSGRDENQNGSVRFIIESEKIGSSED